MGKPDKQADKAKPSTELATQQGGAVATVDDNMFAADAGHGMEGATHESFAIPFLSVLQSNSPQVDESDGKFIEGAKAGMLYENITGKLVDGKVGVHIIPAHYRRVYLRWGPRSGEGSGFKGEMAVEEVAALRQRKEIVEFEGRLYFPLPDGSVNEKRCDRVVDTRNHYVLLVDPETGEYQQALFSLRSTQVKKSKALMSALASVRLQGPSGPYQPATFASMVKVTTVPEKNDDGSWYGVKCEIVGRTPNKAWYLAAKAFHESVMKGEVQAKYEDDVAPEPGAARQPTSQDANRF